MQSQTPRSSVGASPSSQSTHSRWQALTHRCRSSHSSFLYGVKSTKIYCRPTCPARLARRANVVFFDTEDQAQHHGFRPCKRCQPDNASFIGDKEEVVMRVIALLRVRKDESTIKRSLDELAKEVGVTPSYLCRVFKKTMGMTVGTYIMEFEREPSETETESLGQLSVATTERSPPLPVESLNGELAEQDVGNDGEALDFNLFNLNEWFWMDDFLNDSNYGYIVGDSS